MAVNFRKEDPNSISKPGPDTPPKPVEKPPQEGKRYLDKNGKLLVTQDGLELITHFEGYYPKAYVDPVGVVTIGWGTIKYPDGRKVKMGDTVTEDQARELLMHDIWDDGAKYVRSFLNDSVEAELTDAQFSALVSLTFNRGAGRFRDFIAVHLNKRDFTNTILAIKSLNWAIENGQRKYLLGLDRRRWAEARMFEGKNWREFDSIAKFQEFKKKGYR